MKKIIVLMMCAFVLFGGTCLAADRYQWMFSNDLNEDFFDTLTIKYGKTHDGKVDKNIIDVWIMEVFSEAGVNEQIALRKKHGLPTEGWNELDKLLIHEQLDIKNNLIAAIAYASYSKNGTMLCSYTLPAKWNPIVPGSVAEGWLDEVQIYATGNSSAMESRAR